MAAAPAPSTTTTTTTGPLPISSRKLVLLGESAVGKSSLALRYVKDDFQSYRESTIGAAFLTQTVNVKDGIVKFEIWDTAGQERYKSLAPMYYRGANASIVTYDLTSLPSLAKAQSWITELQRQADPSIVICLAGNKLDLAETQRQVSTEEARSFAEREGLLFFEVSAKSGEGVAEMFQTIANKLPLDSPAIKARAGTPLASSSGGRGGVDLASGNGGSVTDGCAC